MNATLDFRWLANLVMNRVDRICITRGPFIISNIRSTDSRAWFTAYAFLCFIEATDVRKNILINQSWCIEETHLTSYEAANRTSKLSLAVGQEWSLFCPILHYSEKSRYSLHRPTCGRTDTVSNRNSGGKHLGFGFGHFRKSEKKLSYLYFCVFESSDTECYNIFVFFEMIKNKAGYTAIQSRTVGQEQ